MKRLDELYYGKKEIYERAIRQVEECINDIVKDFASDKLFRVDRVGKRLKKLKSIKLKAYKESIPLDERVFDNLTDIAGVRIVVNNLSDIEMVVEKIKESTKLDYDESSYEDKISVPEPCSRHKILAVSLPVENIWFYFSSYQLALHIIHSQRFHRI